MTLAFWIAGGGALGALARYGLSGWVQGWAGTRVPWGTFLVNVSGSLLIGLSVRVLEGVPVSAEVRGFATIGLLGAFTTFSTYTWETVALLRSGEWLRAAAYALGSVAIGLAAVVLGLGLGDWILRVRG